MAKAPKRKPEPVMESEESAALVDDLHYTTDEDNNAEFVEVNNDTDIENRTGADVEAEEDEPEQREEPEASSQTETEADDDDIPEELKKKSPKELARMYREAQTLIGRQGQELGDLRRHADQFIKFQMEQQTKRKPEPKAEPEKPVDELDFFTDPKTAIERAIAQHPKFRELETAAQRQMAAEINRRRQEITAQFQKDHPDAGEIVQDPEFQEWVGKSRVRQDMLLRAHKNYDLNAANEIFGTWKELQSYRKPKQEAQAPAKTRKVETKAPRTPTGGNAAPRGSETGGKKIYRRADVIRLMTDDPERYALMADEITKAYAEGRVK